MSDFVITPDPAAVFNVGRVTSYADAIAGGYTGTREEWEIVLANLGTTAAEVEANRQAVAEDKAAVEGDVTTVEGYKDVAAQSASEAAQSAESAHADALAATAAKEAAQTAQGIAEEARVDAVSAQSAAAAAQTAAESASGTAQAAAQTATTQAGAASDSATAAAASAASVSGIVTEITAAKTEAITAIETKGAETLESIPDDYTELSGDVDDLKSALEYTSDLVGMEVDSSNVTFTDGKAINYRYANTLINSVVSSYSGYIPIPDGFNTMVLTAIKRNVDTNHGIAFMSANDGTGYISGIKNLVDPNAADIEWYERKITIPGGAKYFRTTWLISSNEDYSKFSCVFYKEGELAVQSDLDEGGVTALEKIVSEKHNLINYGYDTDDEIKPYNGNNENAVGIKRKKIIIELNTNVTSGGSRIKVNGTVTRTGYSGSVANAVVDAWEGITLQQYHKYRVRWVTLSGTINDPSTYFVSVYTQGTHSTIGNSVRVSETEFYRDFVYNTTPVNIVLAIASGAEFTNYKGMLILEDLTETFADYANPINAGLESGKNVIDYHYMSKYASLPDASAASAEVIGIEQIKETIRLNGTNNQGGYIWIRLNDGVLRTKTSATVDEWSGMAFENGHKYRIVSTMISGTVTYPSGFDWVAIPVSVYKTGTHSTIASADVLDNGQYVAEFEYDSVRVSLALIIPDGTVFADAIFTITLIDITEFPNSGYNYLSTSPFVGTKKLAYNVSKLWSTSQTGMQGIAVYNGVLFQALNNNNYTNVMQTYNLSTGAKISEFSADIGHGNTINFGKSKYDPSDDYPLLYCACYDSTLEKRVIKVLRVTSSSATLVKTYMLPDETEIGYHAQGSIDEDNGIFVLSTYKQYDHWQTYNAGDKIIITTTKQIDSAEYDSESGCYLLKKEKSFELPWYGYLQEGKVYGGYYWLLFSKPSTDDTIVYVIDYLGGGLHTTMTDWVSGVLTNEAEGIDFIEDIYGEAHMIIGVATNGVYKVDFSQ